MELLRVNSDENFRYVMAYRPSPSPKPIFSDRPICLLYLHEFQEHAIGWCRMTSQWDVDQSAVEALRMAGKAHRQQDRPKSVWARETQVCQARAQTTKG